jgi:hypothetical protein
VLQKSHSPKARAYFFGSTNSTVTHSLSKSVALAPQSEMKQTLSRKLWQRAVANHATVSVVLWPHSGFKVWDTTWRLPEARDQGFPFSFGFFFALADSGRPDDYLAAMSIARDGSAGFTRCVTYAPQLLRSTGAMIRSDEVLVTMADQ